MNDRDLLGPADVDDAVLARIVGTALDDSTAKIRQVAVEPVAYDLPALTTAGRWWVSGTARTSGGERPFRVFVKHIQTWARSPFFAMVPEHVREYAEAGVPWRTEGLVYRSDLAERLPDGLRLPRALDVIDLDGASMALWLEAVAPTGEPWTLTTYEQAAYLIGRLAASTQVRPLSSIGEAAGRISPRGYAEGRIRFSVEPALRDRGFWAQPELSGPAIAALRDRLLAALERLPGYVDELDRAPLGTAHGDTCPNNLLRTADQDGFVLIDYGFWSTQPVGFDLAQLVLGDAQLGAQDPDLLTAIDEACLPAFVDGIRAEGSTVPAETVARVHALKMLIYSGLSALVLEPGPPGEIRERRLRAGARIAELTLDRVAATAPID